MCWLVKIVRKKKKKIKETEKTKKKQKKYDKNAIMKVSASLVYLKYLLWVCVRILLAKPTILNENWHMQTENKPTTHVKEFEQFVALCTY